MEKALNYQLQTESATALTCFRRFSPQGLQSTGCAESINQFINQSRNSISLEFTRKGKRVIACLTESSLKKRQKEIKKKEGRHNQGTNHNWKGTDTGMHGVFLFHAFSPAVICCHKFAAGTTGMQRQQRWMPCSLWLHLQLLSCRRNIFLRMI